ncbi:class I SAM-dependent methyltransferase [Frigoriflavimonas asaccharolytica]|uniref:SAM-dependent methyltransferase n=1 Tax=Frigoriflavimonas asaccharolytica TaxID=2735899 RepID=A0A8J8G8Z9_9FLAO|nr:class I SAM-dependent methyltransferase [Frigoriflavimonas asaccharolytica]NRS91177.1 SAM-dependent methyltransferase [Frigoriflavimonas asaccharolytica]
MKIVDHLLTKESFVIVPTEIEGILKTSPVPQNIGKYYESDDYISHNQDEASFKQKIYKIAQYFNLNYKRNIIAAETFSGAKVLDYGCGAGEFIKYIQNDFETFGYEPDEDARNIARNKASKTKIISDINLLEDSSLDVITLWHVFEHVENQKEMMQLFHQKLNKDGVLIIAVPNHTSYDAKYYKEFWAAYDVPRHIFHFSKNGMLKLFNNEIWKLNKIKPLLLDSFYISILSEKYKKNPLFWLKGTFLGAISNFKAIKNNEYSSLVYIIEKK